MSDTRFSHVELFAGDPILALTEQFNQETNPNKVNLGVGIYYDHNGKIPVLTSVRTVEQQRAQGVIPKPYQPIEGAANFRQASQRLMFGEGSTALSEARVATIQSVGGSGALKVGADFLKRYFPNSQVWISNPSWENHRAVFEGAGFTVNTYPYYDPATMGLDFPAMLKALEGLEANSIVLLHVCCHNPTGVDLTQDQWRSVQRVCKERQLITFMDIAYQGFGDGINEDSWPVRLFADDGIPFFLAQSYSKNFSLYGERCGALHVHCENKEEAERVLSQLKFTVRRNYSSPPTHGGQIVAAILSDGALRASWEQDLTQMRQRIKKMRSALQAILVQQIPDRSFDYFTSQRGMFSYTGLSPEQVDTLKTQYGIYLVRTGRMCMSALNEKNVEYVGNSMASVLKPS
jgi:aromatic-amino-acid transaminase